MDVFSHIGNIQQQDWTQNIHNQKNETNPDSPNIKKNGEEGQITNLNDISKEKKEEEIHKEKETITKEKLQDLTTKLNKEMAPLNPDIKFQFNDKINELVVNVVDKHTDKVIRKIPSNEALKIMEKMRELVGALFDDKG
jgi:flagellar protein FlaG